MALVKALSRHYIEHHDTAIAQDIADDMVDEAASVDVTPDVPWAPLPLPPPPPTASSVAPVKRTLPVVVEEAPRPKKLSRAYNRGICTHEILNVSTASELSRKGT